MTKPITRRNFLRLATNAIFSLGGLLGLGGLFRFFSFQPDPGPPTEFALGPKEDYPETIQVIRPDIPAAIKHTEEGVIAISMVCTHLGCTVDADENKAGFTCPCHGSHYNANGNVLKGPATKALPRFRIEEQDDETLMLFTN